MSFNIRKPFARRQTDHAVTEEAVSETAPPHDAEEKVNPDATFDGSAISSGVDQLEKFKKAHKWDYNLDYDTIVCYSIHVLAQLSHV